MYTPDSIARAVAARLEGARVERDPRTASTWIAEGRRRGVHVRVACWSSNRSNGWSVETKGSSPPVRVVVSRRGGGDRRAIASGAIVEVLTGDADFDRDWLVEGAPAQTARDVLDADVRARIAPSEMLAIEADGGAVKVGANARYEPEDVEVGIEAAVAMAARLAALAKTAPRDEAGRREAEREIAALRAKQDQLWARASWPARVVMVVAGLLLASAVLAGTFYGCIG